jgi:hypothetical protein
MPTITRLLSQRAMTRLLSASALAALLALMLPAASPAALTTIGSPLSVPATLNTAENLNYAGTNTAVPPSPEFPSGEVHTYHNAADAALWNTQAGGAPTSVPADGQAMKIRLEGCAQPAAGGPPPLTQIHFQALSPLPGGGAKVSLSSGAFNVPVCGVNGAGGHTLSTYEPVNLCVHRGDWVAFNEEGGFVPHFYQSGVRFNVLGAVPGSGFDSFIRGNGTNNGAVFSPLDSSSMDGFAFNGGEELMMQVLLGTGPDARYACPGGTKDAPPVLAPIRVSRQTDGVNAHRVVAVAIYCRTMPHCMGTATLRIAGEHRGVGSAPFTLQGNSTGHLPIRLTSRALTLIRRYHGVSTTLTAVVGGQTFTQTIRVMIF